MSVRIVKFNKREGCYERLFPIPSSLREPDRFLQATNIVRCITHKASAFTGTGKSGFRLTNLITKQHSVLDVGYQNYNALVREVETEYPDAIITLI